MNAGSTQSTLRRQWQNCIDASEWPTGLSEVAQEQAVEFLIRLENNLVADLKLQSPNLTPAEWLWYLRRVHPVLASGDIASTEPYVRRLAESLTTRSSHDLITPLSGDTGLYSKTNIRKSQAAAQAVLRAKQIHRVHSLIRYCNKGATLQFADSQLNLSIPDSVSLAARVYDARNISAPSAIAASLGTYSSPSETNPLAGTPERGVRIWGQHFSQVTETPLANHLTEFQYSDSMLDLESISDLINNLEYSQDSPEASQISISLCLLRIADRASRINLAHAFNASMNGYTPLLRTEFQGRIDLWIHELQREIEEAGIKLSTPRNFDHLLGLLGRWKPQSLPLMTAPPLRLTQDVIFIDLISASHALLRRLEYPNQTGKVANDRGNHFESALRNLIDETPWRPNGAMRKLIGKSIKNKKTGETRTDLDAIAAQGDRVILIDAKSRVYSGNFDAGAYKEIRNSRDYLEKMAHKWLGQIHELVDSQELPELRNKTVTAVVCTPFTPYLEDPDLLREIEPGLRVVTSAPELKRYLEMANPQ